jgi:DNA replication and repair protein RecF
LILDTVFRVRSDSSPTLGRVSVTRLSLTDFRCHRLLRLDVGPEPVVIVGANGTGKTSVLEALSLLGPGRGLRRARLVEMLRTGGASPASAWSVRARLLAGSEPTDIVTAFSNESGAPARDRRQVRIDGQAARGGSVLAQTLGLIWLTPEMDRLFTEGPSARRRFLDRLVWGMDPAHATRVSAYERAMQQRSALLRQERADPVWLGALEEAMTTHGIAVAAARRQTTVQLSEFGRVFSDNFPRVQIEARGVVEEWLDEGPALIAEERFRSALAESRPLDAETGGGAFGPHRSDMVVRHGGSGRPAQECSTGEQKMLLIALVLAGARLQRRERGKSPLMLLDDVMAHLDARHRSAVFDAVADLGAQVWYTGTDQAPFEPIARQSQVIMLGNTGQHSWTGGQAGTVQRRPSIDE